MTPPNLAPTAGVPAADRAEIQARIGTLRGELDRLGVRSLRLFGSGARDQLRPDSDVDVLVEFDGPTRFRTFMAVRWLLEDALGRRVDLATPAALNPSLVARITPDLVNAA